MLTLRVNGAHLKTYHTPPSHPSKTQSKSPSPSRTPSRSPSNLYPFLRHRPNLYLLPGRHHDLHFLPVCCLILRLIPAYPTHQTSLPPLMPPPDLNLAMYQPNTLSTQEPPPLGHLLTHLHHFSVVHSNLTETPSQPIIQSHHQ